MTDVRRKRIAASEKAFIVLFAAFMVIGRLVAWVHWLTDIVGEVSAAERRTVFLVPGGGV